MLFSSVAGVHFCFKEDSRYCEMKDTHRQNGELCGLRKRPGGLMGTPDSAMAHVSSACAMEMLPEAYVSSACSWSPLLSQGGAAVEMEGLGLQCFVMPGDRLGG